VFSALALDPASEPEPDIAIVSGSPRDYRDAHPSTALLIVEVADASLAFDRTVKASLYARAAIPEYWLLNLVDQLLEVHRNPGQSSGGRYALVERHQAGDRVAPLFLPDRFIAVAEVLP
jgi:Uma2 family endonuclease